MIGNNQTNFPHKLLLLLDKLQIFVKLLQINYQPISNYQKLNTIRSFLGRLLGSLLKTRLPLIKNVIKPLAKSLLILIGLTAAAAVADTGIHKKVLGSGNTTLMISNDEIHDIIKIIKSLDDSGLLIKGVTETVQNKVKEQKGGFLSALLRTLGANLLGNRLTGKGIYRAGKGKGKGINRADEGVLRTGYGRPLSSASQNNNKMDF